MLNMERFLKVFYKEHLNSYGEPPAPSKPACSYVNVGCAGNGHDYGTKNCTCGHGYGGYQCGCKCPRGCVE